MLAFTILWVYTYIMHILEASVVSFSYRRPLTVHAIGVALHQDWRQGKSMRLIRYSDVTYRVSSQQLAHSLYAEYPLRAGFKAKLPCTCRAQACQTTTQMVTQQYSRLSNDFPLTNVNLIGRKAALPCQPS